ncbi:MAG: family serine peptidase, partial [Solirubrobacterales bacterium]|nr:family serine peptidase [Solirubrobacterales bacterium]
MRRLLPILATMALLAALAASAASAAAASAIGPAREFVPRQLLVKFDGDRRGQTVALPAGIGVRESAATLRRNPRVAYAEPDYLATASATEVGSDFVLPNDPGTLEGASEAAAAAGDWTFKQWNFLPSDETAANRLPFSPGGIDAIDAWHNLEAAGRPGAEGVTVAVLDTGVAYRDFGSRFVRSPDFAPG